MINKHINSASMGLSALNGPYFHLLSGNGLLIDGLVFPSLLSTLEMPLVWGKIPCLEQQQQQQQNVEPRCTISPEPSFTPAVLWVKEASYTNIMWTKCVKRIWCSPFWGSWIELWHPKSANIFRLECFPEKRFEEQRRLDLLLNKPGHHNIPLAPPSRASVVWFCPAVSLVTVPGHIPLLTWVCLPLAPFMKHLSSPCGVELYFPDNQWV